MSASASTPTSYSDFLATKEPRLECAGFEPGPVSPLLWPFAADIVRWAIRGGRRAVFADCGLSKTRMQLEIARQYAERSRAGDGDPVLICAPLGVVDQTIAEGAILGLDVRRAKDPLDITLAEPPPPGSTAPPVLWITNYERLERFASLRLYAILLDESSILKSVDGKTRTLLINEFSRVPHRFCFSATPAPNDVSELANHAEFLGVMSRVEMLATFFVHDSDGKGTGNGKGGWRLKGHAESAMWRWMARWAVYVRRPSDLGYSDDGFVLPALDVRQEIVKVPVEPEAGSIFATGTLGGVGARQRTRKASINPRVERALEVIRGSPAGSQWVVWCGLNPESTAIAEALGSAAVEIAGDDADVNKIDREARWRRGEVRVLVTKPKIFGHGMNWQHCANVLFLGLGDSYEQYYQSIRRCWRFGQRAPVDVRIVISDAEGDVANNVRRKETEAARMAASVVAAMREVQMEEVRGASASGRDEYTESVEERPGSWKLMLGDCVKRIAEIESASVGLSIFSPPFAALYTYSASARDMGNCRSYEEFFEHYSYLVPELLRVTKPGRRACVHVQQVTTTKTTHGVIGWRDFRADVVKAHTAAGWVYDGEIVIDKDPQAQAIRTKSKALMFVQKNKDSSWSRPAMADYILLFRAPGENAQPIVPDVTNEEWILWARPIWYGIRESDTLQAAAGRDARDEKHICPLQLGTIERCVRLWSNPGDLVLSPFAGIGSEGWQSVRLRRRFVGIELKPSYWRAACRNLASALEQGTLFDESVLEVERVEGTAPAPASLGGAA